MRSLPVITIGGSAGALEPLRDIMAGLPAAFPAAVAVVVHASPDYPSHLPDILNAAGPLPAHHAQHDAPLLPGHVYVAPPDHHLLITRDRLHLSRGPKENRSRPSIDVLFRSAAYTHRGHVTGVVLSGLLDDGTSGLWTIKRMGGTTIVQHPKDAAFPNMPGSALAQTPVDHVLPVREIAAQLKRQIEQLHEQEICMNEQEWRRLSVEVGVAAEDNAFRQAS